MKVANLAVMETAFEASALVADLRREIGDPIYQGGLDNNMVSMQWKRKEELQQASFFVLGWKAAWDRKKDSLS